LRNLKQLRPSPALVVSTIALFVALGGSAFAAATIGTSDIKDGAVTNKKLHDDAVRGAKVENDSLTGRDLDEKTLNQVPSANHAKRADRADLAGTAINANNVLSAVVGRGAQGCTLLRATQPGTSANIATGHSGPAASACVVDFSRDVTECTYIAGIGENFAGEAPAGLTTTAASVGNQQAVFVRTMNISGDNKARPFHLQVVC
jgi:hypothetical protein